MNEVTFNDQASLLQILESQVLKKSLKEVNLCYIYFNYNYIFAYSKIKPEIVQQISDFNCFRKLHLAINTDYFAFKEIFSRNLQKTITDLRIKEKPKKYNLEEN